VGVSFVTEIWNGRTMELDDALMRTYMRVFRVITNDSGTGPIEVQAAYGIPRLFESYFNFSASEEDRFCLLRRIQPRQSTEDPNEWLVNCEYSTRILDPALLAQLGGKPFRGSKPSGPNDMQSADANPLNKIPDVRFSFVTFQRPLEKDLESGKPIVNSAGTRFDPPVTYDESVLLLTFTRNEAVFNVALAAQYKDSVNSDTFLGFSPGWVKLANIGSVRAFENNQLYYKTTYEFQIKYEDPNAFDWQPRAIDMGYLDKNGNPIKPNGTDKTPVPWPLNGAGLPLTTAQAQDPTQYYYRRCVAYRALPFQPLNING
jgi:hypothetical protein